MKASLFSLIAAATLLASSTAFAAAPAAVSIERHDPNDRYNDRNSKDFNYGYNRNHRVTATERARWEAAHRNDRNDWKKNQKYDRKDDRRDDKNDRKDDRRDDKNDRKDDRRDYKDDRKDDRNNKDFNYGYDKKHRVTAQERARWEAAHRNDRR
ncbi:hypothetical protein I2I05_04760 [Hymenobacter sp. BT683]|uniref:Uncharacterized protein n=1 Tax=Hymenobacter jeongseonensis TaxID=2791027 RepID=A0ABS0IED4_9BACT|nr:hypothetical protein [Hymenobacter jeongseonensis]MBF9236698.1 hypothetical protein [Hymenobacter jeongseonensis]